MNESYCVEKPFKNAWRVFLLSVHQDPKIPEHQSPAQELESNRRHSELFQTLGMWQKSFKFSSKHMENQMVSL